MRLFLCEKPSQGKDIGRILGATQRGEGCLNGSGVTVTWCIGHLVEAAPPEAYDEQLKRWSVEQLPIIPQHWRVEVKPKTATQFKVVKALLAGRHWASCGLRPRRFRCTTRRWRAPVRIGSWA